MTGDAAGAEAVLVPAPDGRHLAARLWRPVPGAGPSVVAVIAPAMGIRQELYAPFAAYLARRGIWALTFDYRGVGASLGGSSVREVEGDLLTWARQDVRGVLGWVHGQRAFEGARVAYVGHSMGIPFLGLADVPGAVDAVVAAAAPHAHWRHWEGPDRVKMWLLWHILFPGATRLLGYFPGRALGLGADLPAPVARQWARWGRHPDYIVDADGRPIREGFRRLRVPLLALSSRDDPYSPPQAVEALLGFFVNARGEHRVLEGADLGLPSLGHLDFFRDPPGRELWDEMLAWLIAALPGESESPA